MKTKTLWVWIFLLWWALPPGYAQVFVEEQSHPTPSDQRGFNVVIAMDGFGLGASYRKAFPGFYAIGASADIFVVRGEREIPVYDPYLNGYYVLNKESQLFLLPINLEIKKQLFATVIEQNFQPHVFFQGGVIFGINFPEKQFYEIRNLPVPPKEYKLSYNMVIGIGADIVSMKSAYLSIRPQFRYVYFPQSIAGQKDHSTFEIFLEFGKLFPKKEKNNR